MIENLLDYVFMLVLIMLMIYLIVIIKIYKRKTNIWTIVALQVLIPCGIIVATHMLIGDFLYSGILLLLVILVFLAANYTDFWFRQHYRFDGERVIILNFKNCEPDPDTVNTYTSRFQEDDDLERILRRNFDLLVRLKGIDPFRKMIAAYYEKHSDEKPKTPKSKTKEETEEETIDEVREQALVVFQRIFQGFHFHVLYMHWFFFMDVDETIDLHSSLKLYILSLHPKLRYTLDLNCVLLQEEHDNGKKFTPLLCIDGYRDEAILSRINNLSNDLEFFKFIPKFFELEALQKKAEYFEAKSYRILDEASDIYKHNESIETRIQRRSPHKKRRLLFSRGEVIDE